MHVFLYGIVVGLFIWVLVLFVSCTEPITRTLA